MTTLDPHHAFHCLVDTAKQSFQRRLLLISGDRDLGRDYLSACIAVSDFRRIVWISDTAPDGSEYLPSDKAKQLLGQDLDCLIYDCHAGLDPDGLGAAAGAISGGGLLVLLTPALNEWPDFADPDYHRLLVHPYKAEQQSHHFISFFRDALLKSAQALIVECDSPEQQFSGDLKARFSSTLQVDKYDPASSLVTGCVTADQRRAVDAVMKVLKGHRRRPLVISSDRGRGKSSALGIASAELFQQGANHIVVTAPRLESVKTLFHHCALTLGIQYKGQAVLEWQGKTLQFIAPDKLSQTLPCVDLLLVDEAAAIPSAMLELWLQHYSRIAFASTVHGYEGTGRGFAISFRKHLNRIAPQWKALQMSQPIRWAENDPVEACLFDALLLGAGIDDVDHFENADLTALSIEQVSSKELLADKILLKEVFALLVIAHYQTTPTDLRNLLDGLNVRVWVLKLAGRVAATALVTQEGGFDTTLCNAVWKGERRLRGHLLPQTLSAHAGVAEAPKLNYLRIMRIAVSPLLQRRGLGLLLLEAISDRAEQLGVDILGSSFALTSDVLSFWVHAGLTPARLGVSRDSCSGAHSAIVLMPLTDKGEHLFDNVRFRFLEQLPYQLGNIFQGLSPSLVSGLMLGSEYYDNIILDEQDWLDIQAFTKGYRVYEVCSVALWKLACCYLGHLEVQQLLTIQQRDLLIMALLQSRPLPWVSKKLGIKGKKALLSEMRTAIAALSQQRLRPSSQLLH